MMGNTAAIATSVAQLLEKFGTLTKLGSIKLGQIDKVLGGLGVGGFTFCEAFPFLSGTPAPAPCKLAAVVSGATAGVWLATNVFRVSPDTNFTFYLYKGKIGVPTLLILPSS